ncbi:hypothetical protein N657DRAFT_436883 [Parathielavia appendiculata]|uniref:Uncharacterized protein n=1 Tax=Parathielavia appendiculata TaxID=2587402 RepID=A0AAN6Z3U4_9PEZI|nr:hypothetical protein N657DRAFT_436883 [Parathielavia appendiculata]
MSSPLGMELDVMPGDEASLKTNSPRRSLVASLHRKTSHLLGRNPVITNTADNTPLPVHPGPLRSKPSWFHSVGARLQSKRHNHAVIQSSDSSQEIEVELEEGSGMINPPSSPEISPETSRSRSPERRRTFSGRLRLRSLPAKIRRRSAALFRRTSSSNPSDEDKENLSLLETPPAGPVNSPNTGSWSSFRSGVQRAVREMVDGNFCFPEDHGARRPPPPPRSPARVPLRTLWTIMSADSSESRPSLRNKPAFRANQVIPPVLP